MRIAYLDCYCGLSPEMILGALIDCGLSVAKLQKELDKLKLPKVKIKAEPAQKGVISGTKFNIQSQEPKTGRKLKDILDLLYLNKQLL